MNLFSAVFQDFKLFAFTIEDNIIFSSHSPENRKLAEELLNKVGLSRKISSLQKGIDTNVYKEFDENGFEPSGGEAQILLLHVHWQGSQELSYSMNRYRL